MVSEEYTEGGGLESSLTFQGEKEPSSTLKTGKSQGIAIDNLKQELDKLKAPKVFPACSILNERRSLSHLPFQGTSLKVCCRFWLLSNPVSI